MTKLLLCSGSIIPIWQYPIYNDCLLYFLMSRVLPWNSPFLLCSLPGPSPLPGPAWFLDGGLSLATMISGSIHLSAPTVVIGKSIPQHKKEEQLRISKQGAGKRLSYHIIADTYFWIFFHMVFAFILIPSAWDKSDNWIHFLATPGFSLVPSLPSEDTFIFHSLIQLVWICKHMFAGRNLDDCNLKLKRTKTAVT